MRWTDLAELADKHLQAAQAVQVQVHPARDEAAATERKLQQRIDRLERSRKIEHQGKDA